MDARNVVELDCGCSYTPRHNTGDRKVVCDCGTRWVLTASPDIKVDYTARKLKNQENG